MDYFNNPFSTTFCITTILIGLFIYCIVWYKTKTFSYWKDRGVPFLQQYWIFGSARDALFGRISWHEYADKTYRTFKDHGFGGIFSLWKPALYICSPELIERVLVTDFEYFHDRWSGDTSHPLMHSLVSETGDKWRALRRRIVPECTSRRLQGMFDQIFKCSDCLAKQIDVNLAKVPIEMDALAFRYSTEVIASCGFGVELLSDSAATERFIHITNIMQDNSPLRVIKMFIALQYSKLGRILGIKYVKDEITEYFLQVTQSAIEYRHKNGIKRNDILQTLMESPHLKSNSTGKEAVVNNTLEDINDVSTIIHTINTTPSENLFTKENIASSLFGFLTSGTNPTTMAITFSLLEVARHFNIQKKLQEEIDSSLAKHGGWCFEAVKDMPYLDQVIQEVLRIYTYNPALIRTVTRSYTLPGTEITLPKGMLVYVPASAIHMDPQFYPSPEIFNPDRFHGNRYKPSTSYMPFGDGPRICVSIKFAITIIKVCLARILSQFVVNVDNKTQLPLVFEKRSFFLKPRGGIWLMFDKRG